MKNITKKMKQQDFIFKASINRFVIATETLINKKRIELMEAMCDDWISVKQDIKPGKGTEVLATVIDHTKKREVCMAKYLGNDEWETQLDGNVIAWKCKPNAYLEDQRLRNKKRMPSVSSFLYK